MRSWGEELFRIGFSAPEQSYLRDLFAVPRTRYLERLLDRPKLLEQLPRYRGLQDRLRLGAPGDTELGRALEVLRRVPELRPGTIRWIERLRREGYRFAFADLDLLAAAADRPALRRAVERPDSIRRLVRRRLGALRHAERQTTDLPEGPEALGVLSRTDLARIDLLLGSLASPGDRGRILGWVRAAREDSVETGGAVVLGDGGVRWVRLPSATEEAGRYRRPAEPRFAVELAGFHVHATPGKDRPVAGPSLMDVMSAAFHGGPRLVVTDLGEGCFNADYYRDAVAGRLVAEPRARLDPVALDLGVFCGTTDPPTPDGRTGSGPTTGRPQGNELVN
ncbi:MAG: hypothetical protein ABEJ46_01035 [Gemmatimonadota bacterium]